MTLVNFNVVGRSRRFSGKRARSKHFFHDKVADDGPDLPWRRDQREGGPTEEECSHFHQDAKFASHPMGMWLFCQIGPCWRSMESVISAVFFFFFVIVPRLQPHLPLGFVGGAYERGGWCFVEACAVSCENVTRTETLVSHTCFSRVLDANTGSMTKRGFAARVVCLCGGSLDTSRRPFRRSSRMMTVAWT